MSVYVYDTEVFSNFFSATFMHPETDQVHQFCVYAGQDQRSALAAFLRSCDMLIGFNSINYDDPMLHAFLKYLNSPHLNTKLYNISSRLITGSRDDHELRQLRYVDPSPWKQMDLMKIMAFDTRGISLKRVAINLRWHRIQDLPFPHDAEVGTEDIHTVLDYNLNDVLITRELFRHIQPQIKLRHDISQLYEIDVTNASDSKMANLILESIYCAETGKTPVELRPLRTKRDRIKLADCIAPNVAFQTQSLQKVLANLQNITVSKQDSFKYTATLSYNNVQYELGVGGLHSKDQPGLFVSDDQDTIRDADVGSYYPNIMICNHIRPEHLDEDFIPILRNITTERLAAKKAGEKVKADALKITVNSIFGKLGSETFWLEDPQAMLSVTVSGQLYLLMLIEALAEAGIPTISANTDGIVCKVPTDKEDIYYQVCQAWEEKMGFALEFTDYALYVRSDVNNYLTSKRDGTIKEKGRFSRQMSLHKSYKYPIVPICLCEYFINGTPVEKTLAEHREILDFCISQKSGNQFQTELHSLIDRKATVLQKNNRFYVSRKGGALVKRNMMTKSVTRIYAEHRVKILNDYDVAIPFEAYDVDLDFYSKEIYKLIREIEPLGEQMHLVFPDGADAMEAATLKQKGSRMNTVVDDWDEGMDLLSENLEITVKQKISSLSRAEATPSGYYHCLGRTTMCPHCGSLNFIIMEKWGTCSMCDQSWDVLQSYNEDIVLNEPD
jgi:hypothetical protein